MAFINFLVSILLLLANFFLIVSVDQAHLYTLILVPALVVTTFWTFFDMAEPY